MFPFPPSPDHDSYYDHGDDDSAPHPAMTGVSGALADVFSTAAFGELVSLRSHLSSLVLSSGSSLVTVINTCDPYGLTLLHTAAREGHMDVVEYLLQHGAQDMPDTSGMTALHAAAGAGHVQVVKRLLQQYNEDEKKRVCNLRDKSGRTPLHWATRNDADSVAHILIAAGADVTLVDGKGEGALGWMSRYRSSYYRSTDPPPSIPSSAAPYPTPSSEASSTTSTTAEDEQNQQAYQQMLADMATYKQQPKQPATHAEPPTTTTPTQQTTTNTVPPQTQTHQQSHEQSHSQSQSQSQSHLRPGSSQPPTQRHVHFATSTEAGMRDQDMTPIPSTSSSSTSSTREGLGVESDATVILTTPENYAPPGARRGRPVVYTHDTEPQPAQTEPRELPPVDYR